MNLQQNIEDLKADVEKRISILTQLVEKYGHEDLGNRITTCADKIGLIS